VKGNGVTRGGGFTLLEVMLAVAMIAIALTAVLGSQTQSVSIANESKFSTTAPLLAQGKMAEIEVTKPEQLSSDSGDFGEFFPNYHWKLKVSDVIIPGAERISAYLKRIDLLVAWGEDKRYEYRLRLYRFFPMSK
jgi:general secretion pathway protein I